MTKQRKVRIHVESLKTSGRRFVDAWQRAERGEPVHEEHLSFESLERLLATLSPKRIELVRFVRRRPNLSIAAIARELGRDYKRVHSDVRALEKAGPVGRRRNRVARAVCGSRRAALVLMSEYPPAKPRALGREPLEAAVGSLTRPCFVSAT